MLAILAAAGLFMGSCSQPESEVKENYLEVSPESLVLDPQGGQESVSIRSSADWLIRTEDGWVKATTASGKASSENVKANFTFESNTTGSTRETRLVVKAVDGATAEVKLSQQSVDPSELAKRGISTAEDLVEFSKAVNEGGSLSRFMDNGVFVLLNNIDASSIKEWIPIGTKENPFTGVFNGKDFTISNINWTVDASKYPAAGFFGYCKSATIRNFTLGKAGDKITVSGAGSSIDAGAIAGYLEGGSITYCTNTTDFIYNGESSGANVCVAGICGRYLKGTSEGVSQCENAGNVMSPVVCRAAGIVAYNEGLVNACTNKGAVLSERSGEVGPAWCVSYNKTPENIKANVGKGYVGDYKTYVDNPKTAPSDAYLNAVASPAKEGYDMAEVTVDHTKESYYNWTEVKTMQLAAGVKYTHYDCDLVPRKVHVLEINLADPSVEVTTSYANDCIPNPNGNKNSNNGFKVRETLSQLCDRKRREGQNIIAGINTGFFDSNDGISRGFHIEEGEPVYINNPAVVSGLPNHSWGLTVFTDGTASCGKKGFSGRIKVSDKEFNWLSMNDTIMRNTSEKYQINLYDYHYKQYPHPSNKSLTNKLAKNALYVIAEYEGESMKVNGGYAKAKVVSISDGRSSALASLPYITSKKQVGISLSGAKANEFGSLVKVGTEIEFRCDMTIEGETTRPIYTQNSTMYHIFKDGKDNTSSIGSSSSLHSTHDPITFPVISQDKKTLWLIEVDGRQGWYSTGLTCHEIVGFAKKLGGYNVTRFDGGGSSTVWIYDAAAGKGKVVNSVSDSKGERSCLNYMLIRLK